MDSRQNNIAPAKLLCFDVYGTLIDWEAGLCEAAKPLLERLSATPSRTEFLRDFADLEAEQQARTPGLRYPELLATVYTSLAARYKLPEPPAEEATAFGTSIKDWNPFPDTVAALAELKKQFKLVVLSNVDRKSFSETVDKLGGENVFDAVFTAEEIGCYKPELAGFKNVLRESKETWDLKEEDVRVIAASLFHDHVPAKQLGLRSVWVHRGASMSKLEETGDVWDLRVETLGELAEEVRKNGPTL